MRVGVVGGGAAGLTTAWLLEREHDVTVFEREARLGGHAHTVEIEVDGQRLGIDAGFQFFAPGATYATFNRLLDLLGVARESYAASLTVYDERRNRPVAMPPFRAGAPILSSFRPATLRTLIRFRAFLDDLPAFLARHDMSVTVAEYLERARLPKAFVDGFLLPLLSSFWCVELAEFRGFAAHNALYYLGANANSGLRAPVQSEIPGGMRVYIDALARDLTRTRIRLDSEIQGVTRRGELFDVEQQDGEVHTFDRLVLACNPRRAAALIDGLTGHEAERGQLRRIETFDTKIAIHGDRRLMPRDEASWSVVNARWDGAHSSLTVWDPRRGLPVFKSWITSDTDLPDPLYAVAAYEHGMITPAYFDAQSRLKSLNGRDGLWLAGLSMHDVDSHESAVRSAVAVARSLAPDSWRLRLLSGQT